MSNGAESSVSDADDLGGQVSLSLCDSDQYRTGQLANVGKRRTIYTRRQRRDFVSLVAAVCTVISHSTHSCVYLLPSR